MQLLSIKGLVFNGIGGLISAGPFEALLPIDLVAKDLDYFSRLATAGGAETPLSQSLGGRCRDTRRAIPGASNITAIAKLSPNYPLESAQQHEH